MNTPLPQRRRREIFVEPVTQCFISPVGATYPGRAVMPLLRSWNPIGHRFYKYSAPTVLPKLRAAPSDAAKATLPNRSRNGGTTDQQIDQLVYELYELTPEEIALVEGA